MQREGTCKFYLYLLQGIPHSMIAAATDGQLRR